jgi:hypothetical protein
MRLADAPRPPERASPAEARLAQRDGFTMVPAKWNEFGG